MRTDPALSRPLSGTGSVELDLLLGEIRSCRRCAGRLPHEPRPVVWPKPGARLLIIGQAPSTRVHATGLPWNDASGDRLRGWLQIDRDRFYGDPSIAVMPMGFCYPGKGNSGDLPPRRECAPAWHQRLWALMPDLRLVLLVGSFAQRHYLRTSQRLTDNMCAWRAAPAPFFPLPHPSPRNIGWFLANPWFDAEVVPALRARVDAALPALADA
ncbi:MAG TPA: uracil-DNA glycosylase family protein [Geminicoccus sp.]|jgi:uracil-DNA glycosylase|uniref:uracil-DNA glycosylase family protein n=1 Tax=Geminicoccus sp. TaxID=2024832 RepID=UPI002E31691A|nr:uracil-DNA glycosylase family protein [Geminicoccus sp.]HEX2525724.1 uracil-DNA glycosylase family protein [Geminicoccus sp.]